MNIIEAARGWLGMHEGTAKHREFIDTYNRNVSKKAGGYYMTYSDPWCAAFVSECADEAGLKDFPYSPNCQNMYNWARNKGAWGSTPCVGGLVLFDWNGDGIADHVGIIETVSGQNITTIEGNTSDQCARRTYTTGISRGLMGFISIPGASNNQGQGGSTIIAINPTQAAQRAPKPSQVTRPVLRYGSRGPWVVALQALLTAHGYNCGRCGYDGDFGNDTRTALMAFQRAKGIAVDGEAGNETFRKLVVL